MSVNRYKNIFKQQILDQFVWNLNDNIIQNYINPDTEF